MFNISIAERATQLACMMHQADVIPMPEEADRHIATFEVADENSVGFWVAPSMPLVAGRRSNSTQGGYEPYWNVFPLHVNVAEKALFEVGLVNNTDEDVQAKLTYTVEGSRTVAVWYLARQSGPTNR